MYLVKSQLLAIFNLAWKAAVSEDFVKKTAAW